MFETRLEAVGEYDEFDDFCHSFALSRGKSIDEEESDIVGEFKVTERLLTTFLTHLHLVFRFRL